MEITEHHIKIEKTARYYTNNSSGQIKSVWLTIHGYAHLAKDFIKEFSFIQDNQTLIIAPEGLSKFYFRNKIGASWMTKEDRRNEIDDYLAYLDKLLDEVNSSYDLTQSKLNLLGFSQGVHTAARWFINSKYHFDNLFLCSSDFPKDADFVKLNNKLHKSKLYFIYGNSDLVIEKNSFEESINLLKNNLVEFEEIIFDGGHEIFGKILKRFI